MGTFAKIEPDERGMSLLSLLFVLVILGVMAAVTLGSLGFGSSTVPSALSSPSTIPSGTPASGAISAVQARALSAACESDFVEIEAALQVYQSLDNSLPPAGTGWALGLPAGSAQITTWPNGGSHFRFVWNGRVLEVVPHRGRASLGSAGTSSPASGCYSMG